MNIENEKGVYMVDSFNRFFKSLLEKSNLNLSRDLTISEIRYIISRINEYFYTNYEGIGFTKVLDEEFEYFSEFHKFWEKYHRIVLNPQIDEKKCEMVADVLHDIYIKNKAAFYDLYDTVSLKPEEVCKVRYFSASQDFRGSRDIVKLFNIYNDDPSIFDKYRINDNPEWFLKSIGVTTLSQNDKRVKYAKTASQILIEKNIEPFDLLAHFDNDILQIRNFLIESRGAGFGNKKTDMFLRDMVVLGVWQNVKNFDMVDVASDINTVKVAFRTGILKTEIPLVSSFLDIFCYQYTLIDEMNAFAWRKVWKIWHQKYPSECIESPCLIDYLVYRVIGKDFCKESLSIFECETKQHMFKWHSARNRTCQVCFRKGTSNKAYVVKKVLPCTDPEGYLVIQKSVFVSGNNALLPNITECPFVPVCEPKNNNFRKLNPPKSISILGQTGWETAKTRTIEGGGGLMS